MKFMLIVKGSPGSEAGKLPTSEQLATMSGFNDELLKAGVLLDLSGLHPVSQSVRVKYQAGKRTVIDGPYAEAKEVIAGYWLIQVKSRDEALEWAKRAPMDCGLSADESAEVEVRQLYELDEFGENAGVDVAREFGKKFEAQQKK